MSLILKGIDLPSKDKSPLVITVWADGVVCSVDSNGGIEETTSAIQIPKEHGRLIDADASLEELRAMKVEGEIFMTAVEFAKITIKDAPTILEAEEADELNTKRD